MYQFLDSVVLKSGEKVEAVVVVAPDEEWYARLRKLLFHKGDLWRWQVEQLLTTPTSAQAFHYVLHRDGEPFSHILTAESDGVGLLGHVWTQPPDRSQGAASQLMRLQMQDFGRRGGRALYLSTTFDSSAFHIYRKQGFRGVEPQSGVMDFFSSSRAEFESEYFASGETEIVPLDWSHWASGSALFAGDWPGVVRNAAFGLVGRYLTEGALLPAIREQNDEAASALVLQKKENGAVVGLAGWKRDATWPETIVADVYAHPNFWHQAGELLARLEVPPARRVVAYVETDFAAKRKVLESADFKALATLPQWLAADVAETKYLDVVMMEKS